MKVIDEKSQAQRERGTQKECGYRADRDCVVRIGFSSSNSECQPFTSNRDDRTGGTSSGDVITAITGGILEQLILESKEELTNSEARVNQLHDRIKLLESLKASLDI